MASSSSNGSTDPTHGRPGHLCSTLCGVWMIRRGDRHAFDGIDKRKPCATCGKKYTVGSHF